MAYCDIDGIGYLLGKTWTIENKALLSPKVKMSLMLQRLGKYFKFALYLIANRAQANRLFNKTPTQHIFPST